jgi:hypothetical protein
MRLGVKIPKLKTIKQEKKVCRNQNRIQTRFVKAKIRKRMRKKKLKIAIKLVIKLKMLRASWT